MKSLLVKCAAALMLLSQSSGAFASEHVAAEQDAAALLKTKLTAMPSFYAKYQQSVTGIEGNQLGTAQGELYLAKPTMMRLAQSSPDTTLLVANPTTTYYFDEFAEQVTIMDTNALLPQTPFVLLTTDDDTVWAHFSVSKTQDGFMLKAKDANAQVSRLDVHFEGNALTHVTMHDATGQKAHYSFSDQVVGKAFGKSLFSFTINDTMMVDDQRQQGQ